MSKRFLVAVAGLWWVVGAACDDSGGEVTPDGCTTCVSDGSPDGPEPDMFVGQPDCGIVCDEDVPQDAAIVDAIVEDATMDAGSDADAAWVEPDPAHVQPEAAAFRVGAAIRRMPVVVGMPTSGFGPSEVTNKTPFAQVYPGTDKVHTHPDLRVVIFEAGEGNRIILVRTDTIGISAQMRRAVVAALEPALGPNVDHQLIISGTHTHSGPGRLIDKPLWRLIQDNFFPEFFVQMRDALVGAINEAMDDLQPAQVGHGLALTAAVHSDRRCANPEETEPEMPFIRVDDMDGQTRAVVVFHAVHGTVLGADGLQLSQDVTGGIEAKLAETFDHPVVVLFMNGAAGDMGVGSPRPPRDPGAAEWPDDYLRIEALGVEAATAIRAAWDDVEFATEGVVHGRTARVPLNRQVLGYGDEFRYEWGAVYCGAGAEERCLGEPPHDNLTRACVPMPDEENAAPLQSPLTVGRIGERYFVTGPGEFSTALGRRAREAAAAFNDTDDVVFMGYAQEYTGYSLPEDDWWQGGYESTGALWGPRQGDHLTDAIVSLARSYANPRVPLSFEDQAALPVPGPYEFEPWPVTPSPAAPAVLEDVGDVATDTVVRFTFAGGDPWLGTPVVRLETETENGWVPVRGPDDRVVDSDGYVLTLQLTINPPYDVESDARTFAWLAQMPATRAYGGGPDLTAGTFRLVATGRAQAEGEPIAEYTLPSGPFTVRPIE